MGSYALFATLALLVGAAVANIGFKNGHEYEFKYTALAAAGIPTLKNQFAGALLIGKVKFQRPSENVVYMKIESLQAIELNGPVPTGAPENILRDLQQQAPQTAQETVELTQVAPAIQKTVRIQYEHGKVRSIDVSRDTQEWIVNIKKGIIAMISVGLNQGQNQNAGLDKINRLAKEQSDAFINYAVIEDGVEGKCEATYSVSADNWEANPNAEVLNVTKIRNMNKCNEKVQFTQKTLQDKDCKHCHNEKSNVLSHLTVTKYNLRGNRNDFEFERIEAQGQMIYAPSTVDADHFLTNTSRLLQLRQKQPIQQQLQGPSSDAKKHESLEYKFPSAAHHQNAQQLNNGQFDVRKAPATPFTPQGEKKVQPQQVEQLIQEIAQAVRQAEHEPESDMKNDEILSKSLKAKRLMRMLDYQEIEQIYQQARRSDKVAKRVAQDIMVMAGTAPAIMVLKKAIETEEIRGEEAAIILQQIPTTIYQPHYVLLEEFAKLTKSEAAKRDSQIYSTAWLSYGTLIGVACNGTGNSRETPSFVKDDANCPQQMKERFLADLEQELRKVLNNPADHWRQIVIVQAIGNTLAPKAAEILKPIISGQATNCPVLRSKAIYALTGAARLAPRKTVKELAPIYFNQEEMSEVRIAALSMLVTARPEHHFLNKIAASTWTERSQQVGSFTYSTLKALSQADNPCMKGLKKDAKRALALANQDFDGNLMDSGSFLYDNDKMAEFNTFNTLIGKWVRSNDSMIPTAFSVKLNRTQSGQAYTVFKLSANQKGLDEVLNRIAGPKAAFYPIEKIADLFRSEKKESHKGLRSLVDALQIDTESRETSDIMVNLYFKLYDTQARNFHISKHTIQNFLQGKSDSAAAKYLEELVFGNGVSVQYSKIFNTEERQIKLPTSVGLPVIINVNKPVFFAVRGEAKVEIDSSRNPSSVVPNAVRLTINGRPTFAMKKLTTMGIKLPFAQKFAAAGVSRDIKLSLPVHARVSVDLSEGKMTVVAGRSQESANGSQQQQQIAQFKVTPFTTLHKIFENQPIGKQQSAKPIKTKQQPKQSQKQYLSQSLGLPVVIKTKTEEDLTSTASFINKISAQSLWNLINQWEQPRSAKARQYTVELRNDAAETRQAELSVAVEFTPAAHQRALKNREYTPSSLWSYLNGWSSLPMPCKPAGQMARDHYAQEESDYEQEQRRQQQEQYGADYEQNSAEQDDDYEQYAEKNDNDSYDESRLNRDERRRQHKQQKSAARKQFWAQWNRQDERDNQEQQDQFDDESDESDAEYTNQGWSRRSSSASKTARRQQYAANRAMRYAAMNERNQYDAESERPQQQLNIQKVNTAQNAAAWKVTIKAKTIGGQERAVYAVISGKRQFAKLQDAIQAEIKVQHPKLHSQQADLCIEAFAQYPAVPCSYDQTFEPRSVGPIRAEAKVTWGQSGCSANNKVHIQAKIGKSGKQLQSEQEAKPWYYKQCMEERQKGNKFDEACTKLYNEITRLNKIEVIATYQNLPLAVKNATHKMDTLLKAAYYAHMSNDAVTGQNQPQQIRIVAEFEPKKKSVDVKIQKPSETTIYSEIKTNLKPLSAHRSIGQQVADAATGGQQPATCSVSNGKYVNTFNNQTYKHQMGQCTYLAARDCSPNGLFAVLVSGPQSPKSGNGNGIHVEVQLLKHRIQLKPKSSNDDKYEVTIDGEKHQLNQDETLIVDSGKQAPGTPDAIAYVTLNGHFVHVNAPAHGVEVKYDGKDARIEASNFYQGKMCGLCGPFDGETKTEFVSPKGCLFAQADDFAESYIVPDGQCQNRQHNQRQLCKPKDESRATYPQLFQSGSSSSAYSHANGYRSNDYENDYESSSNGYGRRFQSQRQNVNDDSNDNDDEERNNNQEYQSERKNKQCATYRNKVVDGSEAAGRTSYNRRLSDRLSYSSFESEQNQDQQEQRQNQQQQGGRRDDEDEAIDNFELSEQHRNQICFSTEPVLKCKPGCKATRRETRTVRFHCLDRNDYAAKELQRKQPHQPLDELEGKRADFTKQLQVPTQCQSDSAASFDY